MLFDPQELDTFPTQCGVYLMRDNHQKILYVGKAVNLKRRLKDYFVPGRDGRRMVPYLTRQVATIETIVVGSEKEALLLENTLIKKHQPKYNVHLKDDKRFFSLTINHKHQWPMLRVARYKGTPPKDHLFFGPYTDALAARSTLNLLRTIFPLRQCSDRELVARTRPCILYEMKKCKAPCVNLCTKNEYDALVNQVITFLKGHDTPILKRLEEERDQASKELRFEQAQKIHRMIQAIERTLEKQRVEKAGTLDQDALGFFRYAEHVLITQLLFREGRLNASNAFLFKQVAGEDPDILRAFLIQHYENKENLPKEILLPLDVPQKQTISKLIRSRGGLNILFPRKGNKKELVEMAQKNAKVRFEQKREDWEKKDHLLMQMEEDFSLTHFPETIACIDHSSLSGSEPVSAWVQFYDGNPDKSHYKRFKLKETAAGDDYGALEEVLVRHFSKAQELPDLLLIDGGKGHLNRAIKVLERLDISTVDVIAIAKEEGRHDMGSTQEQIFLPNTDRPLFLKRHSPLLFFLQRIRDEAHRFAITYQKKRRSQNLTKSELDHLIGIGPVKKKRLLTHFGSIKRLLEADQQEWQVVKGINKNDCQTLAEWKHAKLQEK